MFQPLRIAPSILSANFMNLQADIDLVESAGAGFVHIDVMDGHFVPNLSMGVPLVKQLKRFTGLPLDVHLMVSNPDVQVPWFLAAGADVLTVHAEALDAAALARTVALIRDGGARPAVSIKPATPVSVLDPVIAELDMVLVMSVEPGFSGQGYIEGSERKVAEAVSLARAAGNDGLLIEADGGIGPDTVARVAAEGADVIVCGNAVFGAPSPADALREVARVGDEARLAALAAGVSGAAGASRTSGGFGEVR